MAAAFPDNSTLIDNFNRTENPLSDGGKWTTSIFNSDTALQTEGSNCENQTDTFCDSYRNDKDYGPSLDLFATVTAVTTTASRYLQIAFRLAGALGTSPTGYGLIIQVAAGPVYNWFFERYDSNGTHNTLGATVAQTIAVGDMVGIRMAGSTMEAWYKASAGSWTQLFTRDDSNYTSAGKVGLGIWSATGLFKFDDFSGGTMSRATTVSIIMTMRRA